MRKETKQQIFAIFVLLMFAGSSLAFAVSVVLGRQQPQTAAISDKPFADSETARFLENNIVVVDFYYSQDCADCAAADSAITGLAQDLSGYLAIDRIDAEKYKSLAEANEIMRFPSFVLKGATIDTISGATSKQYLKSRICLLYAEPISACSQ